MSEPEQPKFSKMFPTHDKTLFPEPETSCLLCYGHGWVLKADLKYSKCVRCGGSGVDPKKQVIGESKSDYATVEVLHERMTAVAEKRKAELQGNKGRESKPNSDGTLPPSSGINGSSNLDI